MPFLAIHQDVEKMPAAGRISLNSGKQLGTVPGLFTQPDVHFGENQCWGKERRQKQPALWIRVKGEGKAGPPGGDPAILNPTIQPQDRLTS